jgi:hypothetical protein
MQLAARLSHNPILFKPAGKQTYRLPSLSYTPQIRFKGVKRSLRPQTTSQVQVMNAIDDHLLKSFRLTGEIVPSVGRGLLVASDSTFWQSVVQSPLAAGASILGAGATIRQPPPSTSCTPSLSLLPRLLNDPDTAGHENCCKRSSSSAAAAAKGGARFRILMAAELRLARRPASHPTLGCRCLLLLSFPPRSLLRHPQSASLQPSFFASVRTYHSALRPLQAASLSSGFWKGSQPAMWTLASGFNWQCIL